jgi:hypothetical protein
MTVREVWNDRWLVEPQKQSFISFPNEKDAVPVGSCALCLGLLPRRGRFLALLVVPLVSQQFLQHADGPPQLVERQLVSPKKPIRDMAMTYESSILESESPTGSVQTSSVVHEDHGPSESIVLTVVAGVYQNPHAGEFGPLIDGGIGTPP